MKLFIAISILLFGSASSLASAQDNLERGFVDPPASAKARAWWHWINGNVDRKGITADLEAMQQVGIQEVQIFSVSLGDPRGAATYLSPLWLDLLEHAANEAQRLGLEVGFHNGPGWSSSGGPWVTPKHAMQTVVFSETACRGGERFVGQLPQPKSKLNYYRDIAVLAFPKPKISLRIDNLDYKILSERIRNHLVPDAKPIPIAASIDRTDIVDLSGSMNKDGVLTWDAPAGDWVILRIGHTPKGTRNRPAPVDGRGLECDKMSRAAVDEFWAGGVAPIIEKLDSLVGETVTNCVIDSYEVGATNWTPGFDDEFKRLRGYDCRDFLPTLAGYYVEGGEVTERFLWDFRRTIGDLIAENYYGHFRKLCHQHGMKLSVEPYWGPFDNMQVGENGDIVMCEFWSGDVAFFDTPKFVASIAKLKGDSIVGAEAFTGAGGWTEHPATIKSIGDRAWAQGINRFIFHSYVHQPWDVGPGLTLSYHGLEFNRLNTWWKQGTAFLDYVGRSQFLLQQGQSVADVLVFTGESSPNNTFLMPEIKSLGYDYDLIGANRIESLTVEGGLIRTETGATYRVLVLPETSWMRPETLDRFAKLVKAGATILGPQPKKSPSLQGFPDCDERVSKLANQLWGEGQIQNRSVVDFLNEAAVPPDFEINRGARQQLDFIHRRAGEADIYFIANSRKEKRHERCRFRVTGKQPELWNAETGETKDAVVWQDNGDGTTSIPIQFDAEGSVFVVFKEPVATSNHVVETTIKLQRPSATALPNLKIIKAEYGTFLPDGLVDVTQSLANQVDGNKIDVIAGKELCDCDPAPGYKKELRLQYKIGDRVSDLHVEEREAVKINAAGDEPLVIVKAIYGKFAKGLQGLPADPHSKDVTSELQAKVASGVLQIPVDAGLFEGLSGQDNAQNQLHIVYSTGGEQHQRRIGQGRTLNLTPNVPDPELIWNAGRLNWQTPYAGELTYQTFAGETKTVRVDKVPEPVNLSSDWKVVFLADSGTPIRIAFDELASWSLNANRAVRYFSGTATYKNEFTLPKSLVQPGNSLELDLGNVRVIAEVTVNGKNAGVLWKSPFRVKLDGFVQAGINSLEVKVTNLWANRLIGDEQFPNDVQRKGPSVKQWPDWLLNKTTRPSDRTSFAAYRHWKKDSPLQPSGLIGPVSIRSFVRVELDDIVNLQPGKLLKK